MSAEEDKLFIVSVDGDVTGPLEGDRADIKFPANTGGWSMVLDCRHEPYTEKSLAELRHYADHVHKDYVLVTEGKLNEGKEGDAE